jgi:hypothetical protein
VNTQPFLTKSETPDDSPFPPSGSPATGTGKPGHARKNKEKSSRTSRPPPVAVASGKPAAAAFTGSSRRRAYDVPPLLPTKTPARSACAPRCSADARARSRIVPSLGVVAMAKTGRGGGETRCVCVPSRAPLFPRVGGRGGDPLFPPFAKSRVLFCSGAFFSSFFLGGESTRVYSRLPGGRNHLGRARARATLGWEIGSAGAGDLRRKGPPRRRDPVSAVSTPTCWCGEVGIAISSRMRPCAVFF